MAKNSSSTTKKAAPSVVVFIFGTLVSHIAGTQWFAHGLNYNARWLGQPLVVDEAAGVSFYPPWNVWMWGQAMKGGRIDELITTSLAIAVVGTLGCLLLAALVLVFARAEEELTAHGSSRWATAQEIKDRGLRDTIPERVARARKMGQPDHDACSIVLGKDDDGELLYDDDKMHMMVFAPTRAGKGVSVVIPTLLTWRGSCVVFDIKGENFQITAFWRSIFSHVIYFSPTSMASACWNPLLEIRLGARAISDAMNIAEIMGESDEGENVYFTSGAKRILSALFLYILYVHPEKHMGTCVALAERINDTLEEMAKAPIANEQIQTFVRNAAQACLEADDKAKGSWAAGAQIALYLWKDPIIVNRTSTSDFRLIDIQYAADPLSVYLVIPPNDLGRLGPLVRLFTTLMTNVLCESLNEDKANERHRLLMLCDEFPAFGKMDQVETAIAYTAGYDIRWLFIGQGLDQYARIYSKDNSFLSNCHTRIAFRPNDSQNATQIARLIGKTTGVKEQEGESGQKGLLASLRNRSISHIQFERDLMTEGEIQQLDGSRVILLQAGENPILAHKVTYYDDPRFVPRYKGKRWALPTKPLDDFPESSDPSPSSSSTPSAPSRPTVDAHETARIEAASLRNEAWKTQDQKQGDAPESALEVMGELGKVSGDEIDQVTNSIPEGMSATESAVFLTTRSITADSVRVVLERAVRAGKLPASMLIDFDRVGGAHNEPAPKATPTPTTDTLRSPDDTPNSSSETPEPVVDSVPDTTPMPDFGPDEIPSLPPALLDFTIPAPTPAPEVSSWQMPSLEDPADTPSE